MSIPSGFLLTKIGYKKGMLIGLATMGIACLLFLPAASMRSFPIFMLAYFILASGMTVLQVAANPYVAVLGSAEGASSRLILAQAFNSVGTTLAPMIGGAFLLSETIKSSAEIELLTDESKLSYFASEAATVEGPFTVLAIALIGLAVFIALSKLPTILTESTGGSYQKALKNKRLLYGAIGIFVYVGAEVSIGSFAVNYFSDLGLEEAVRQSPTMNGIATWIADLFGKSLSNMDGKGVLGLFVTFYWGGAMVGRFIGAYLTRVMKPAIVLALFGLGAIAMILLSISTGGFTAMWALICVGLFNSVMFPTIFTLAIEDLGPSKPNGSGILCTAIVGGAVIPFLCGNLIDYSGFHIAYLLCLACYAYIGWYGIWTRRLSGKDASEIAVA
jgi:FHS family L-fucose permease-like MFS transporter